MRICLNCPIFAEKLVKTLARHKARRKRPEINMNQNYLSERVIRDSAEGVLAIDHQGKIILANVALYNLLGLKNASPQSFADIMLSADSPQNDVFYQQILNCISHPIDVLTSDVKFVTPDGVEKILHISTSVLTEDSQKIEGIVLNASDITLQIKEKNKNWNTAIVLFSCISLVCVWVYLSVLNDTLSGPVTGEIMSWILITLTFLTGLFIRRVEIDVDSNHMGLVISNAKKVLAEGCAFSIVVVLFLFGLKYLLMQIAPEIVPSGSFWDFGRILTTYNLLVYPLSVILQEWVARGIIYENVRNVMPDRIKNISGFMGLFLIFGAVHLHLGFVYMLGAGLILSSFGVIYHRHHCIWGVSIVHYAACMALIGLGFVE